MSCIHKIVDVVARIFSGCWRCIMFVWCCWCYLVPFLYIFVLFVICRLSFGKDDSDNDTLRPKKTLSFGGGKRFWGNVEKERVNAYNVLLSPLLLQMHYTRILARVAAFCSGGGDDGGGNGDMLKGKSESDIIKETHSRALVRIFRLCEHCGFLINSFIVHSFVLSATCFQPLSIWL